MRSIFHLLRTPVVAAVMAVSAMAAGADETSATPTAASPTPHSVEAPAENRPETAPAIPAAEDSDPVDAKVADPDLPAERAALHQTIQALADRLAAAAPGTTEVDEVDNDLVQVLEDQKTALAGALDTLKAAEGDAEIEDRWQAVELHGEALKQLVRLRKTARDSFSEELPEGPPRL